MTSAGDRYALLGWLTEDAHAVTDARRSGDVLSGLLPVWFALDEDGRLRPRAAVDVDRQLRDLRPLQEGGVELLPAVANLGFSGGIARVLLENDRPRRKAVESIDRCVEEGGFDGATLCFRGAFPEARDAFSAFVEEIAWALHRRQRRLVVAAAPQVKDPTVARSPDDADAGPQGWAQAVADSFDYRPLGVYADWFVVMTLDYAPRPRIARRPGGSVEILPEPGPVAPIGWLQSVIEHTLLNVPPRQFLLSLPFYGRAWIEGEPEPRVVPLREVDELLGSAADLERFDDPAVGGLKAVFTDAAGRRCTLFADTVDSLAEKLALVARHDLGGAAFWRLGQGAEAFWRSAAGVLAPGGGSTPGR